MSRPRGFASWRPQRHVRDRLEAVRKILDEYRDYLPLTIRQIYYRLVGKNLLTKTEKQYANLCETLNRARRAHLIPMDAIRDDGFSGLNVETGYSGLPPAVPRTRLSGRQPCYDCK